MPAVDFAVSLGTTAVTGLHDRMKPPVRRSRNRQISGFILRASAYDAPPPGPAGAHPMSISGQELAIACAKAADDTKAENICIKDLRGISNLTDFMVVCTANSMPQMRAILRDISKKVEEDHGVKPFHREGKADTRWVVLDYVDVMVHVMDEEMRHFYGLEELWKDAGSVEWQTGA